MITNELIVAGRVQGVGFRYSCRREALRLGLGHVQNLRITELTGVEPLHSFRVTG